MSEHEPKVEPREYDPKLVTWVEEQGNPLAIVTADNLHTFAVDHGYGIVFAQRVYRPLLRATHVQAEDRSTADYFLYSQTHRPEGLLADSLPLLVGRLVIGELRVPNMGARAVGLLQEFAEALSPQG